MVDTSRPGTIDVTRNNPKEILYITGNENTDGSIRIIFTPGDEDAHMELRQNGVFNDTGLRLSAASLKVGRDLSIGAAASFIETFNPSVADEHQRALIPHVTFDFDGTKFLHSPVLKPLDTSIIFGPAVSETVGTTIGFTFTTTFARLIETLFMEVGSIGASAPVQFSIFVGTDNSGLLLVRRNLGISEVVADTTLSFQFNFDMGLRGGTTFFVELTSPVAFNLKIDAGGKPLLSLLEEQLGILNVVTENLVLNNDLEHVWNNALDPVYSNQFA